MGRPPEKGILQDILNDCFSAQFCERPRVLFLLRLSS